MPEKRVPSDSGSHAFFLKTISRSFIKSQKRKCTNVRVDQAISIFLFYPLSKRQGLFMRVGYRTQKPFILLSASAVSLSGGDENIFV